MKYLVCNLKNKLSKEDNIKYNNELKEIKIKSYNLVVAPTTPFIPLFDGDNYSLASQDITSFVDKTITGEIEGKQLASLGCKYVIVGHSERRLYKGEINIDFINKINNAQENDLKVIYCIGESLEERENGNTYMVLEKQISEVLNNVDTRNIIIAYEPTWLIGKDLSLNNKDIKETINFIKDITREKYDLKFNVIYGGNINKQNIGELSNMDVIDGFLIGSASFKINDLKDLIFEIE